MAEERRFLVALGRVEEPKSKEAFVRPGRKARDAELEEMEARMASMASTDFDRDARDVRNECAKTLALLRPYGSTAAATASTAFLCQARA